MNTQGFGNWYYNNKYHNERHGPGVRSAYELGAKNALKDHFNNIYNRQDCRDAYNAGYSAMEETLKTTVIICDCCGTKIDKTKKR